MRLATLFFILLIALALTSVTEARAAGRLTEADLLNQDTNETGFTLGDLLQLNLLQVARHPLAPETLSRVSGNVHKAPRRGVQFELLTPGDIGATVHFRW